MNTAIVSVTISGIVCLLTLITFIITRHKENKEAITEEYMKFDGIKESLLKVNMKLDQVCNTTTETQTDIKSMGNRIADMDKRVTIMEKENATVWRRIDELREDVNSLKD